MVAYKILQKNHLFSTKKMRNDRECQNKVDIVFRVYHK